MKSIVQKVYYSEHGFHGSSHYHDCHQLILIVGGEIEFTLDGVTDRAASGDLLIVSRYEAHSVRVLSGTYRRYVLRISPQAGGIENRVYSLLLNRPQGFHNAIRVADRLSDYESVFRRLLAENSCEDDFAEDMRQLLIHELLIMVHRRLSATQLTQDRHASTVYAIQRLFESRFHESYTLEQLAAEYTISVSSLSHQFKKLTGFSVMEYLLSCRMAAAKTYLTKTSLSIGEIVETCGFSDCSNFCRTFRQLNGCSPSAFRAAYRDG